MLEAFGNFLAMLIGFMFWMCLLGGIGVALFAKAMKIMDEHRPPSDWSQVPYELRNGASLSSLQLQETRYAGGGYQRSMSVTYDTSTVLPPEYRPLPTRSGPINNQLPAQHYNTSALPPAPPLPSSQRAYPYYNHQQRNQYY